MQTDRRKITVILIITTLAFLLLAAGFIGLSRKIPVWRENAILSALEEGRTDRARRLIAGVSDEDRAQELMKRCDYIEAEKAADEGSWETAAASFARAAGYADAGERYRECAYTAANELAESGQWEEAMQRFKELSGYADSLDQYDRCRFEYAGALAASGDVYGAFDIYRSMGDYRDAYDRMIALAVQETGIEDADEALKAFRRISPEEIERRARLEAKRESLPGGILDVGFYHAAALKGDGTVLALGDNSFGQCDVQEWSGVRMVCTGAYHTVALKRDGTVCACGRDTENQCSVQEWNDIRMIAATDYATFGLKGDGTVVFTGYEPDYYREVSGWTNVEYITGGSYAVAAIRADGTALISHEAARSEELRDLCDICLNTGYAVGLLADGTVVSPGFDLSGWSDVLALSCSGTGVVGLRDDGTAIGYFFRPLDAPALSEVHDAVAIACGSTVFAWVDSEGVLHVRGDVAADEEIGLP